MATVLEEVLIQDLREEEKINVNQNKKMQVCLLFKQKQKIKSSLIRHHRKLRPALPLKFRDSLG